MNHGFTMARKEVVDGVRDVRSVVAWFFYALMGPVVVGLVSLAVGSKNSDSVVLTSMMVVFTHVSAFVGGMNSGHDCLGTRAQIAIAAVAQYGAERADCAWEMAGRELLCCVAEVIFGRSWAYLHSRELEQPLQMQDEMAPASAHS